MKHLTLKKTGVVIFLCLILSLSCGGKVTTRSNPTNKFTINGVVVKDLSLGKDIAYFTILRDSVAFDSAVVKAGTYTLNNQKSGKYLKEATKLFDFEQTVSISITSAKDNFTLATSVVMPSSFHITSINRDSVTSSETNDVTMTFSLSAGASGYFKSIVRPDKSNGYTELIPANEIGNTPVPRDAFYEGQTYVVGWYKIYLVAYRASFLTYPGMAFFLPDGLPSNNISGANGTIGAGVVALQDSIKAR